MNRRDLVNALGALVVGALSSGGCLVGIPSLLGAGGTGGEGTSSSSTGGMGGAPPLVPGGATICAGQDFSCAIRGEDGAPGTGHVFCWGNNQYGVVAPGAAGGAPPSGPQPIDDLSGALAITCGGGHVCVLLSDGSLACWGDNEVNQLGRQEVSSVESPALARECTQSGCENLAKVAQVAAGEASTCALFEDAHVACWGHPLGGEKLEGGGGFSAAPVAPVATLVDVSLVSVGTEHACALDRSTHLLSCWGQNGSLQLGNGSVLQTLNPVAGPQLVATALALGDDYSCAADDAGALHCWGMNPPFDPGGSATAQPFDVPFAGKVRSLAAGAGHACVVTEEGQLKCWGADDGQIGDGVASSVPRPSPIDVAVPGGSVVEEIAVGSAHTCARTADGAVRCWGSNAKGQLGQAGVFVAPPTAPIPFPHS